jgi:hypothetical protein
MTAENSLLGLREIRKEIFRDKLRAYLSQKPNCMFMSVLKALTGKD